MKTRKMKKNRSRRLHTFSLIEAIAALLLVAIVLPAAMQGVSLATRASSTALKRRALAECARFRMAEIIADSEWSSGDAKGTFDDYPDYRWQLTVSDWEDDDLKELILTVYREDDESLTYSISRLAYEADSDDDDE